MHIALARELHRVHDMAFKQCTWASRLQIIHLKALVYIGENYTTHKIRRARAGASAVPRLKSTWTHGAAHTHEPPSSLPPAGMEEDLPQEGHRMASERPSIPVHWPDAQLCIQLPIPPPPRLTDVRRMLRQTRTSFFYIFRANLCSHGPRLSTPHLDPLPLGPPHPSL